MVVNLGGYGDFDMRYVDSVWLAPEGMSKADVKFIIDQIEAGSYNTTELDEAMSVLKKSGFTKLNSLECLIGGGL